MLETVNQETTATANQPEQTQTEEKLFTQEEVNKFFDKRYSEMMSKISEYEEKAKKFDELEEANKTELQKATERAEKLQAELTSMKKAEEVRIIKEEVANATGVPATLLTGETKEACEAQAKAILAFAQPGDYPKLNDGGELQTTIKGTPKQSFAEWAGKAFG